MFYVARLGLLENQGVPSNVKTRQCCRDLAFGELSDRDCYMGEETWERALGAAQGFQRLPALCCPGPGPCVVAAPGTTAAGRLSLGLAFLLLRWVMVSGRNDSGFSQLV